MEKIFTALHKDPACRARTGVLSLGHGQVATPAFMPVGTLGTVKAIKHSDLERIGYNLILANTFHLYLRPGVEVLERWGGLHSFSAWKGNILTDSGGFQIFSLPGLRRLAEEGVAFRSPIDGSAHFFSPEKVVDIQKAIGSDIAMCLDVCTAPGLDKSKAAKALSLTLDWARRSLDRKEALGPSFPGHLFGIVQGNFYKDLRRESAEATSAMGFPGLAIGGLSVGEPKEVFIQMLGYTAALLPEDRPHYVMGIGSPDYLLEAVENGIDIFDCVLATRMARNGAVFTEDGPLTLRRSLNRLDKRPIQEGCQCEACRLYSRGYLSHLFRCNEMLGGMLATEHNLVFLRDLMLNARKAIENDRFPAFKQGFLERYSGGRDGS